MKIAVIGIVLCIVLPSVASAQTGGYPASPSHGVVGTNPDGTPHYGSEPGKNAKQDSGTVGSTNPDTSDKGRSRSEDGAAKDAGRRPLNLPK